jgi:hypothetical protein
VLDVSYSFVFYHRLALSPTFHRGHIIHLEREPILVVKREGTTKAPNPYVSLLFCCDIINAANGCALDV